MVLRLDSVSVCYRRHDLYLWYSRESGTLCQLRVIRIRLHRRRGCCCCYRAVAVVVVIEPLLLLLLLLLLLSSCSNSSIRLVSSLAMETTLVKMKSKWGGRKKNWKRLRSESQTWLFIFISLLEEPRMDK